MEDSLVIVCLGNPGREYAQTRHNAGWLLGDRLGMRLSSTTLPWMDKFDGNLATLTISGRKVHIFKPSCFMNLSGLPVRKLLDFYKLNNNAILAVHDDLELPFGQIAFRSGGGAGGHNGLRSLDQHLGGPDYLRCRLGIGRPVHGTVADFVLSRFTVDEEVVLPLVLETAAAGIETIINGQKPPSGKLQAFQDIPKKR